MRIAIISDIHSNLEALTAVLADIDSRMADRLHCLGDVVGYGANPSECLALVRSRTGSIVMGNHDRAVFDHAERQRFSRAARDAVSWTEKQLTPGERDFLRTLPLRLSLDQVLLVHGSPRAPGEFEYVFSHFEARLHFSAFSERLCFIGHSHVPAVFGALPSITRYNGFDRFIINPGSVGQPRDGDPRASYGLLDTVAGTYDTIRIAYDIDAAAAKIRDAGLPKRLADRLFSGE